MTLRTMATSLAPLVAFGNQAAEPNEDARRLHRLFSLDLFIGARQREVALQAFPGYRALRLCVLGGVRCRWMCGTR